jgi:hypothetical protein
MLASNMANASHASIASGALGHAFTWPIKWVFAAVIIIFLIGLAAIGSAWLGSQSESRGDADSLIHATQTFEQSAQLVTSIDSPAANFLAQTLVDFFYGIYFKAPQIDVALKDYDSASNAAHSLYQSTIIQPYRTQLLIAMQAIQTLAVRLTLVLISLPLVALTYCLSFAEGLAVRQHRKLGAGRESASLYHRAKFFQLMYSVLVVCTFLLCPAKVWPFAFLAALLTGIFLLARLQWKYYKKYL